MLSKMIPRDKCLQILLSFVTSRRVSFVFMTKSSKFKKSSSSQLQYRDLLSFVTFDKMEMYMCCKKCTLGLTVAFVLSDHNILKQRTLKRVKHGIHPIAQVYNTHRGKCVISVEVVCLFIQRIFWSIVTDCTFISSSVIINSDNAISNPRLPRRRLLTFQAK